jgi:hypothetical protein
MMYLRRHRGQILLGQAVNSHEWRKMWKKPVVAAAAAATTTRA